MMFREIRTREKITDEKEEKKGYELIKPKKELSISQLNELVMMEFNKAAEES